MSDRDAFLAAIRAAPDDDAPRLVYADWLEENGDPDRAEFIRTQIEMEALRRPDTDLDRWRRATIDRHPGRPVPDDFPPELHRYAELARRVRDLDETYRWEWLAPLAAVADYSSHLTVTFRRGLAEEVAIATSAFLESGDLVREACPTLRRLTLIGPRNQVPELVARAALHGIPELDLAGWITQYDARFLAGWLAFNSVHRLALWVGSRGDVEVIRTLATRPAAAPAPGGERSPLLTTAAYLGDLRELTLVQLHGGLLAGVRAAGLVGRTYGLATSFNLILGRDLAGVDQPFARRFPLVTDPWRGIFAGRLPDGPALVCAGLRTHLLRFDPDGCLLGERPLVANSRHPMTANPGYLDLLPAIRRDYGFEPGPIFVREFEAEEAGVRVYPWGTFADIVADPDAQPDGDEHEEACAVLHQDCIKGGNFVVHSGADYWAGPDGTIHAS